MNIGFGLRLVVQVWISGLGPPPNRGATTTIHRLRILNLGRPRPAAFRRSGYRVSATYAVGGWIPPHERIYELIAELLGWASVALLDFGRRVGVEILLKKAIALVILKQAHHLGIITLLQFPSLP